MIEVYIIVQGNYELVVFCKGSFVHFGVYKIFVYVNLILLFS